MNVTIPALSASTAAGATAGAATAARAGGLPPGAAPVAASSAGSSEDTRTISVEAMKKQLEDVQERIQQIQADNSLSADQKAQQVASLQAQAAALQAQIAQTQMASSSS